jgi:hypothetical protein
VRGWSLPQAVKSVDSDGGAKPHPAHITLSSCLRGALPQAESDSLLPRPSP